MTGVTMPYVKPSENMAVHIVRIISALELLKAVQRKGIYMMKETV